MDVMFHRDDKWDGCRLGTQLVAEATFTRALSYCYEALTDGHIGASRWERIGNAIGRRTLIEREFVRVTEDGVEIPSYLEYYPSRAQIEELSKKRSEAGRRGGQAKQSAKQVAKQVASGPAKQVARALLNEEEVEVEKEEESLSSPSVVTGTVVGRPGRNRDDDDRHESQDLELARAVQREVHLATGGSLDSDAALTLARLLVPAGVRDPVAYARKVIREERKPRDRFLPAAGPPPASSLCRHCGGTGHRAADCPHVPGRDPDADAPRRTSSTPMGSYRASGTWPAPEVAKNGAELARDLMRANRDEPGETAEAEGDTMPF
jgi:hypothetical protein